MTGWSCIRVVSVLKSLRNFGTAGHAGMRSWGAAAGISEVALG